MIKKIKFMCITPGTHEDACASPGKPLERHQGTSVRWHSSAFNTATALAAHLTHAGVTEDVPCNIRVDNQSSYRAEYNHLFLKERGALGTGLSWPRLLFREPWTLF